MRVIFTCGGTAGHVNPALALAGLIRQRRPDSEILFVGARRGIERKLIEEAGWPFRAVEISSFHRSLKPREIRALYHQYPELLERALAIEDNAQPNLRTVRGLGRDFAWRDFILADEAQLTLPEIFSADDLPCSCSVSG